MTESKRDEPQVVWHDHTVSHEDRESQRGHSGRVIWFTGLSGSGKSTVANIVDQILHSKGCHTYLLDGDNVRHRLCAGPSKLAERHSQDFANRFGLGFGPDDREENIRRVGSLAQLFADAGMLTLTAFVSPYRKDRELVRNWIETNGRAGDFVEVFVNTPLEICEARDPKGLYAQARAGKIKNFTGISDPYESPLTPELELAGGDFTAIELAQQVVDYLT
jgi:adenylylsulfate kinase